MKKNWWKIWLMIGGLILVVDALKLIKTAPYTTIVYTILAISCFYFVFRKVDNTKIKKNVKEKNHEETNKDWTIIVSNKLEVNEIKKIVRINKNSYNYSEIIDYELIEDGSSILKASLLGTAAKGAVFGLAGLVSKNKKENKYCSKLEIKVTLNDISNPCIFIKFINRKTPKSGIVYKSSYDKVQKCLSVFNIILNNK